jgi:hypothetical protein
MASGLGRTQSAAGALMLRSPNTSSGKTSLDQARQLSVEYRPLTALIPYARNPRTHSEPQVAEIAASIREFGWTNPILVDGENGIIAGHGRLLAARRLGMTEVPVIELPGFRKRRSGRSSSPTTSWR